MNEPSIKSGFARAVRQRRSTLGLSQEQLAERAGLHRTYISDIERGARNLSLENINKLAHALNISISSLFASLGTERDAAGNPTSPILGAQSVVDVLLVEDNPDDVALALHAFKKARFANRIHVVTDGETALQALSGEGGNATQFRGTHPQVVLLDLQLPGMSGIEVLRRIKSDPRTANIAVIVLTVSDADENIRTCMRYGVNAYITKPVNFHNLTKVTPILSLNWVLFKSQVTPTAATAVPS
jgi:CheY-like chemotaxis protein/DNA-binding XRE family transcriptional regulator